MNQANRKRITDLLESQRVSLMAMRLAAQRGGVEDKGRVLAKFWRMCIAANLELAKEIDPNLSIVNIDKEFSIADIREERARSKRRVV
jgi:hypothetical protein